MTVSDTVLSVADIAEILRVSESTVYRYGVPVVNGLIARTAFDVWQASFSRPTKRRRVDMTRPVVIDARIEADRTRSRTHTRKLSVEQRKEAAARYWSGTGWTLRDLADFYGVSLSRMSVITRTYMPEERG